MQKFENPRAGKSGNSGEVTGLSNKNELNDLDFEYNGYNSKMKVECICPKCGERHVMAFHWIGRGTPRKYCPSCKGGSFG